MEKVGKLHIGLALALVAVLGPHLQAQAQDLELGQVGYGGTGCPSGTASVVLSPDNKELSVAFDQYVVDALRVDTYARRGSINKARKSCQLQIGLRIPNGFQVSILRVDYRGYNSLPEGANATLRALYYFTGQSGVTYSKRWVGYVENPYLETNILNISSIEWSQCSRDAILNIKTDMNVNNSSRLADAESTVDSIDIDSKTIYHLALRRCN